MLDLRQMNRWVWVGVAAVFVLLAIWVGTGGDDAGGAGSGGASVDAGADVGGTSCTARVVARDDALLDLPYGHAVGWREPGTNEIVGYMILVSENSLGCEAALASADGVSGDNTARTARVFGTAVGSDPLTNGVGFGRSNKLGARTNVLTAPEALGDAVVMCVPEAITFRDGAATIRIQGRFEGPYCGALDH